MKAQELVEKFYSGQCSEEEKQRIVDYFSRNPGELEDYFSEEDWSQFSYEGQLPSSLSEKLWDYINRKTQKRRGVIRILTSVAVAASVVLVLGLGWMWLQRSDSTQQTATVVMPELVDTLNKGGRQIALSLPDGSVVELQPGSRLQYKRTFDGARRDVYLTGEASFQVAKNPLQPFIVYSDAIATTALGTTFIVSALPHADAIKVKLIEGRVVIKSADSSNRILKQNYYLLPGEEFEWNRKSGTATVKHSKKGEQKKKNVNAAPEEQPATVSNWYQFNNQSLAQVLDQLSVIYQVRIEYNRADIQKINFIGRIEKTDSIQTILNDIALLNHLSVTRTGNTYLIRKK